jgi:hypothetical protein
MSRSKLNLVRLTAALGVVLAASLILDRQASARDVVRIADGDCSALKEAFGAVSGSESGVVILARNGTYACGGYAMLAAGAVELDGAGATIDLTGISQPDGAASAPVLLVAEGGRASLRNVRFAPVSPVDAVAGRSCCARTLPAIVNNGTLVIDASTIEGGAFENGPGQETAGFLVNIGEMTLRNVTLYANHYVGALPALITSAGGRIELSHATIVTSNHAHSQALLGTKADGSFVIGNSIVVNDGARAAPVCAAGAVVFSRGGNVFGDGSCSGIDASADVVAADIRASDYGLHGGTVPVLGLWCDSPAISAGRSAFCEAADARGNARAVDACDAGAFEQSAIFRFPACRSVNGRLRRSPSVR